VIGIDTLDRFLTGLVIAAALAAAGWFGLHHYGNERYQAGYNAAVEAGKAQHDRDAAAYRKLESDQRAKDAARDAEATRKEQEYATNLADAQRRVRAGTDRLRCPANPVQPAAQTATGSVAGTPATDGTGPDVVPEVAADLLGIAADAAGLVSRYAEVVERYNACRAMNAK
jgi:hypothetical protein